jgi:phosphatidylserine/phosphatidylglycerophosphate/cardiolipin synthase-like enzyme
MPPIPMTWFLPPVAAGAYRERHPFGPGSAGCAADLALAAGGPGRQPEPALAVIGGWAGGWRDPDDPSLATLVLRPTPAARAALVHVMGSGDFVFVYRHLAASSVERRLGPPGAGAPVAAGQPLGDPACDSSGTAWVGLAIAHLPAAAALEAPSPWREAAWEALRPQLAAASPAIHWLDPASWYARLTGADAHLLRLPAEMLASWWPVLTKRILVEIRDVHDRPWVGGVEVADARHASGRRYDCRPGQRGILVLPAQQDAAVEYQISADHYLFTALPSGAAATDRGLIAGTPPLHRVFQTLFMSERDDAAQWFAPNTAPLPRFTAGNQVIPLIDGAAAFQMMAAALRSVTSPQHSCRLSSWWLSEDLALTPGDPASTVLELTAAIASRGAELCALVWDRSLMLSDRLQDLRRRRGRSQNALSLRRLRRAWGGRGWILADRTGPPASTQHQKGLVISGLGGSLGFCGGIDLNPDRRDDPDHQVPTPFHDVHACVAGPAVADLDQTFVQRWNAHPRCPAPLAQLTRPAPIVGSAHYVQVTRTYAPAYPPVFAPQGDLGTLRALRRAIQQAQRFIYIEDQYFTPYAGPLPYAPAHDRIGILTDLLAALARPTFEYLLIVVANHTPHAQCRYRRYRSLQPLQTAFPGKVRVYYVETGGREVYVHSKLWIVDDIYVKIGSSNCNRRSLTHDSEVDLHILDGASRNGARRFARDLRLALWGEHLGMTTPAEQAWLEDPTIARAFWEQPPARGRVRPYVADREWRRWAPKNMGGLDLAWDCLIDPDGRAPRGRAFLQSLGRRLG